LQPLSSALHGYIDYKANLKGSLATKVPADYTSQSCPKCGHTSQTEPSKLINNLKTVSSRYLRKEFATEVNKVYWKDVLWTSGYFIASCGGVTVDQLKKYIEEQDRPVE
jgi:putative transposase